MGYGGRETGALKSAAAPPLNPKSVLCSQARMLPAPFVASLELAAQQAAQQAARPAQ